MLHDLSAESQLLPGASTKTEALIENLKQVDKNSEFPIKSIIFSQWTKMLDLIEKPLQEEGFTYVRLGTA
jgi:SWI/SNF-related matrix-associated actin-dependent regulator of chromatin subfamily A3